MQIRAKLLRVGDRIMGLGSVAKVHIFGQLVAVKDPTNMPWPTDRDDQPIRGALMHCALVRMALAECYRWVPETVLVVIQGVGPRYYTVAQMVEIIGEAVIISKAA